jgi:polyferredoxin
MLLHIYNNVAKGLQTFASIIVKTNSYFTVMFFLLILVLYGMRFFACSFMCPTSNRVVSGVSFKNSIFIGRQNHGEAGLGFFQTIIFS